MAMEEISKHHIYGFLAFSMALKPIVSCAALAASPQGVRCHCPNPQSPLEIKEGSNLSCFVPRVTFGDTFIPDILPSIAQPKIGTGQGKS